MISGSHVRFYLKSCFLFCFFKLHFHDDSFSANIESIIYKLLWIVGQLVSSAVFFVLTVCFAAIFLTRWISICLAKNFLFKHHLIKRYLCSFIFYALISCSARNFKQVMKNTIWQYLVHKYRTCHLLLRSQNNSLKVRVCKSSVKAMIVILLVII